MATTMVVHTKSGRSMDLSGEELEEYCRGHGLCRRCAKVKTHKRVVKLFGASQKWESVTVLKSEIEGDFMNDEKLCSSSSSSNKNDGGNCKFLVYKGFCLSEGCYSLGQVKRILGETTAAAATTSTATAMGEGRCQINDDASLTGGRRSRVASARFSAARMLKRPGKRRPRINPDTGSVIGESSTASMSSNLSGISTNTFHTRHSILSGLSGLSGIGSSIGSSITLGGYQNRISKRKARRNSLGSSSSGRDDDGSFTVDSVRRESQDRLSQENKRPVVSPIIAHRVGQLILYGNCTVLDLNNIDMTPATGSHNIDAVVDALGTTKSLERITLERCGLEDEGIEKLAGGLEAGGHCAPWQLFSPETVKSLQTLRLRGNKIGNRGVQALECLFRSSSTLRELDLSDNNIGSMGATSVLESLAQNKNRIPLSTLNLSQNEIWELSPNHSHGDTSGSSRTISFLHTNSTLQELNLDGNLLHDGGAEYIAESIQTNKRCILKKLHLGWNGISDDGVQALAKAMESNNSLEVLGLAENEVTNTGARALLASLAVNISMKEISGLYHNQIDRKFIIVAIKRLLHRKNERETQSHTRGARLLLPSASTENGAKGAASDDRFDKEDDADDEKEESMKQKVLLATELSTSSIIDEISSLSMNSDEEPKQITNQLFPSTASGTGGDLALEAIENWDWGTFGIDEIERKNLEDLEINMELSATTRNDNIKGETRDFGFQYEVNDVAGTIPKNEDCSADTTVLVDRMVVFQAAPLAFFDRKTMQHVGVTLQDFDREARCLKKVFSQDKKIELVFQNATQNSFNSLFANSLSPVVHFSCRGTHAECLTLENGFGYMQALPLDSLKKIIASSKVQVVVISSCNSRKLAEAFLNAGIPHVVSLERETTFFDQGTIHFARGFYEALRQNKRLREAFDAGMKECTKYSFPPRADAYQLLPDQSNHDVEIFFKQLPPPMTASITTQRSRNTSIIPQVPNPFVGREVDIYEILESLRLDDVIRVGGAPGSGKRSVLAVLSRYVLDRSQSFEIDSIYWLPSPPGVSPYPDSLYEDLCKIMMWTIEAEDDIWDEEHFTEIRERIVIEMEEQNTILVIDGRIFVNEIACEMLERFLTYILNGVNVKIILITATDQSRAKTKRSRSDETSIYLNPLDFKSTVRLFGNACPILCSNEKGHNSTIDTLGEFETYLIPPSISVHNAILDPKKPDRSYRQKELYGLMGKGNPRDIVQNAISCTQQDFCALLRVAQRPEVSITCSKELEEEHAKWVKQLEYANQNKYFLRASDIKKALEELEDLREIYPGLEAMKQKENELKIQFTDLLKAKRYNDANFVKRKLLSLKRSMMKDQSSSTLSSRASAAHESILEIQQRMQAMMALAESLGHSSSSFMTTIPPIYEELSEADFCVSDTCTLKISPGCLWIDFLPTIKCRMGPNSSTAMVVWINEACDLLEDKKLLSCANANTRLNLSEKFDETKSKAETPWGTVKCATGDCIPLDDGCGLCIVLAVPPLAVEGKSKNCDSQSEYIKTQMRSAIRTSFRTIQRTKKEPMTIGISTNKSPQELPCDWEMVNDNGNNSDLDESGSLYVTLNTVVDEIRRIDSQHLRTVHLLASSGVPESKALIRIALDMGLPRRCATKSNDQE